MSKPSEYFKSIGEIRAFVSPMKDIVSTDDYELLLYYFGLLENRGLSDVVKIHGEEVRIDKYIAPMIADLNKIGIRTLASCSGLQEEHKESKFQPEAGYISIVFSDKLLKQLLDDLTDPLIKVEEGECYLERSISIYINSNDDETLKEKWNMIWNYLKSRR